ncbi:MAG: RluA family pseudouridine synthase [Elusimicrobiota bacterium]|nr:RluA family pseudouridine synthase [Endomicrobiia bacterium]MDW8165766.1 RluA family pseudouridine synthase [Elusimicrobiota bacterium]
MERKVFKVEDIEMPIRIDKYLSSKLKDYSREYIKALCYKNLVKLNDRYVQPDHKVKKNDIIEIFLPERKDYIIGEIKDLQIIYEDEDILVINKPPFLKVHPAKTFDSEITLVDILSQKIPQAQDWPLNRAYLVHRLDKETSGVLIVAKTPQAQYFLANQFKKREVKKTYHAIVFGEMKQSEGKIIAPIRKDRNISKVDGVGKEAITVFKCLSKNNGFSYLEIYPLTGRTHQIRTHLSFIGYPIIGDVIYKGINKIGTIKIPRVMLHAYSIEFIHPRRKLWQKHIADYPEDFKFFLSYLSLEI